MPLEIDTFVSTGATLPVGAALVMDGVTIGASTGKVEMIKLMDGTIGSSAVIPASSAAIGGIGLQVFNVNSSANPMGVTITAGQSTVTVSGNVNVTFSTASTASVNIQNTTASPGIVQMALSGTLISTAAPFPIKVENALGSSVAMPISGNTTSIISTASKILVQISTGDIGGSSGNPLYIINKPWTLFANSTFTSTKLTSTVATALFSSAASTRFTITDIVMTNAGTVETVATIYDGSTTGTKLFQTDLASAGGGVAVTGILRRGSSGLAVTIETVPASTVYINIGAFRSA